MNHNGELQDFIEVMNPKQMSHHSILEVGEKAKKSTRKSKTSDELKTMHLECERRKREGVLYERRHQRVWHPNRHWRSWVAQWTIQRERTEASVVQPSRRRRRHLHRRQVFHRKRRTCEMRENWPSGNEAESGWWCIYLLSSL